MREHFEILPSNLEYLLATGSYKEIADGVFCKDGAIPNPRLAFETGSGPILIDEGVSIGAFTQINGPTYVGRNAQISPQTFLKASTCVGHTSKVGGEVSGSIIEPYSNKVHFGYLGTSYVGSWVNLGAGTTTSNLKNTYGQIRVEYGDRRVDTGMQFFGCVIGDYSKTAIQTAIYTGKIIGVCSNLYGTVTTNVPSFANYARSLGDVTEHSVDVMDATQKRVFQRRGIEREPRHAQLLRDVYEIEAPKRKLVNNPPSL